MKPLATKPITTRQLAHIAGISQRAAKLAVQRCVNGGAWRGCQLSVAAASGRGGKSGQNHLVVLDSLPADLQQRALELFPELAVAPSSRAASPGKRGRDRKPRVLVGRAWDRGIDVPPAAKAEIAAELDRKVRSLWASPAQRAGWRTVARFAALDLFDLSRAAGSTLPDDALRALCELPRRFICDWNRRRHRKTDIFLHDRKAFHDALPSVQRVRSERPLDVLFGDGTAVDLLFQDRDGRQVKLWAILWLDDCTGRLVGHFLPRPRGEGARMEHVALSFAIVCAEIGFPKVVYVDNGGEYGWVQLLKSQDLARVVQALPYSARSKAIEPAIRVFMDHHVSLIAGYLGNDRMAKKTQTVGRPTTPFPGDVEELLQELYGALEAFNGTPKDGLQDRSAYQVWQAALDSGWRPERADLATMIEALSRPETRTVKRGSIHYKNQLWTSDALSRAWDLEDQKVTVMVPVVRGFPLAVLDQKGAFVSLIRPAPSYGKIDVAGAKEAGRLKTLRHRGARELEREAPPADLRPYQDRFLQLNPPPAVSDAGDLVELDGERGRAAAERRRLENGGLLSDAEALDASDPETPSWFELRRRRKGLAS